ncbi:nucleoside triphosphate pyrophosphohydrolase [Mycobacterium sp. pW045]|uniref:nucleoside triphosphate pyrophosphohydrolase n=1 Tax=Mycobacterium sp. pW045 TaxID=3238984 RepID=UPI00351B04EA
MSKGKLVRDKIPDLIRASGRTPDVRVLDETAYREALHDKLLEEAAELKEAVTTTEVLAEIADVLEVLAAMAALHGLSFEDLVVAAERKRRERGGFVQRWWLSAAGADCLPYGPGASPDVGRTVTPPS